MPSPVTVTKSGPGLADLKKALERIRNSDVLVGIPAQKASRRGKGQTINNAEAMFLFSKGSTLRNQPPRPWIEPAIEKSKQTITPHLEAAARAVLEQDPTRAERELKLAGVVASNAAKRYPVEANGWASNAPSTIRQKGSDRPGISTGQLRRAITSLVRENGKETDAT